jgi:DNA-binding NarL/FixJ family response regulator
MSGKIKVLLAEDHKTVRAGVKMIIDAEDDMTVIGEAGNGRDAIELARELNPDVILMDISMPELNGLIATAKLKRISPDVKILALTRHTDQAYLQELLQAGVNGYLLKQSAADELLRAIRVVMQGGSFLDTEITGKVLAGYTEKNIKLRGEIRGEKLTERESEVLRHIALGYSNREIAQKMDISVKTVEAHKANALKKLDMSSRREIMTYAILQGWMRET